MQEPVRDAWSAETYQRNAHFVPSMAADLVDLLAPQPRERILDIGCGDGVLTELIAARGANVIGIDTSESMLAAARARGLDVRIMDGQRLEFGREFDAVFSNAALHWMREPDAVLDGVARVLQPGGRFVAEFGGDGCVKAITGAMTSVLARRGLPAALPWYFPPIEEYTTKLRAHGFDVDVARLFPRPTPLPTGIAGWLDTFAAPLFAPLDTDEREAAVREIEDLLRPTLCDATGAWTADYVRLRIAARQRA